MRLSPTQAAAVRYLLWLPGATLTARTTLESLRRSGVVVGADTRRRVHPEHRAELCGPAGLTDAERVVVDAALERWRRWDLEEAAADQEAAAGRRLVDSLPGHLRHYAVVRLQTGALPSSLADLAETADSAAGGIERSVTDCRTEAARVTSRAESYEADAATLRDLAAAALATPRPTVPS